MRRLYVRIASGVILAAVVGWAAAALSLAQLRGQMTFEPPNQLAGNGLLWIAAQLDALPESLWNERLAEVRPYMHLPLAIAAAADVPARVSDSVSAGKPIFVSAEIGPPSIYFPLHAGSHFLVAGPPPRPPAPPLTPLLAGALIFVLALTATASAAVGIPLVRRLRSLQNAISELGGGNWAVRLDANAEGALSDLAESINRTAAQLQQQFQEREALLQVVSHEMGTPLSRMRLQVGMLEDEIQPTTQRNRLRALGDDLDELDDLSTELIAWMEPDSSATAIKRDFELQPILESLAELACSEKARAQPITVIVPPNMTMCADQRQFQRAIENLLRNALRYAHQCVVVEVQADPAGVVVEVRDDGPGIPSEQWANVLEPFVRIDGCRDGALDPTSEWPNVLEPVARIDASRSRAHRGLGLGLAIVRRIVEAHGGIVTVTNASEGGTCVRTIWPPSRSAVGVARGRRPTMAGERST
jgi:signal transduction histidine kinase